MNAYHFIKSLSNNKKNKVAIMLFALVLIVAIVYFLSHKDKKTLACTANMVMSNNIKDSLRADLVIKISRTGDRILTQLSGTLNNNEVETNISRTVIFDVQDTCCYSHLVTKSINISSVDNTRYEDLRNLFPLYYLKENENANIYIYPQKNNDFIFSNGTHVYFYCTNTL